jgi:SAM-dependent methyltransferase
MRARRRSLLGLPDAQQQQEFQQGQGASLMLQSILDWLETKVSEIPDLADADVLEVGSFNVNGSPRHVFQPLVRSYCGVDMEPGRDVDELAVAADLPFPDETYDLVISTEMLEHDPTPWLSFPEFARVLKRGGHALITARGFRDGHAYPDHDHPLDCWRFNDQSFKILFQHAGLTPLDVRFDPEKPGIFGHAMKAPA